MKVLITVFVSFYSILSLCTEAQGPLTPRAFVNSSWGLSVDGKIYKRNFWTMTYNGKDLFKDNAQADEAYRKHRSEAMWSSILLWSGAISAISYDVIKSDDDNSGTYWLIFMAGLIPSIILNQSSQSNFARAINIYNGIDPKVAHKKSFDWGVTPIFLASDVKLAPGLAFSVSF